jgi:tetratricopeptide (TPR) repeat protein
MMNVIFKIAPKAILVFGLAFVVLPIVARSQQAGDTAKTASSAASKSVSPIDEYQAKLQKSTKNPTEYVTLLAEFVNKYPYSERAVSYFYSLKNVVKNAKDENEARSLLNRLTSSTEQIPPAAKIEVYKHIGDAFFAKGLYEESANMAQKVIDSFDEPGYLEFKRKQHETTMAELLAKNPKYKPRSFDLERTRGSYVGQRTGAYNLLAKSLWEQGKFEQAEKAFGESFAVKVTKESALGIAKAAEKNGKDADVLKYATIAALTGKLVPEEMSYFYSVYAKQHGGKTDGIEEYLNSEFRKTYQNPVKSEKYKKTPNRSDRTVLVEFVTGAGCIPCIPFDYTFERVLEDYSRKDVALVVYHFHAPTMDPLGNNSSDSRVKYYALNSAPNVFIDGNKFEDEGDYNGGEGEKGEIQPVADGVITDLKKNLELPAGATIRLKAKRNGQKVSVKVSADKFKNVSDDVTLQVAFVENEIAYSGENGLRFHPMVVRALAGDNEKRVFGFKVDTSKRNKFGYVFDVDKIVAQNLAYYDTQTSERMQEFLGRMGGKVPEGLNLTFAFNYKKNRIDPSRLSIVAFLQDNKTKKVLQSSAVSLASKHKSR